jgi:hypothetical protein
MGTFSAPHAALESPIGRYSFGAPTSRSVVAICQAFLSRHCLTACHDGVHANRPLTESGLAKAIGTQLALRRDLQGRVLVFVHGYNTNHQEAVFRVAELAADLRSTAGAIVVFSWPSRASLTGYVADRESVTYSRDYLERALNEIARVPNVRSTDLVAYMGNWLAVETLRQAKLRGGALFDPTSVGLVGKILVAAPVTLSRTPRLQQTTQKGSGQNEAVDI